MPAARTSHDKRDDMKTKSDSVRMLMGSILLAAPLLCAADGGPVITPNDHTNYQGDRLQFQTDMVVRVEQTDGTSLGYACLPQRTPLRGRNAYSVSEAGKVETGSRFLIIKNTPANACSS